jgi:hypothetical protein
VIIFVLIADAKQDADKSDVVSWSPCLLRRRSLTAFLQSAAQVRFGTAALSVFSLLFFVIALR